MSTPARHQILLVEDNPDDADLTRRAFEKCHAGASLLVLQDGAAALDYLFCAGSHAGRTDDSLPVLVLLDLKLPKIDGLEVLQRLRADPRTQLLPVVVVSSSIDRRDVVESYRCGTNSFIRKPVDFVEFSAAVRLLTEYWLKLNQSPFQLL